MQTTLARTLLLSLLLAWGPQRVQASATPPTPDADGRILQAAAWAETEADDAADSCGHAPQARELAELIRQHPLQRRLRLSCHPLLAMAATAKAEEMARRGQVTHTFGVMAPNRRLRAAGYPLPHSYPGAVHNQVEAVSGGYPTAQEALQAFLNSPPHRAHLLAEHPFYAEQDEIAVGYALNPSSEHVHYWAVFIARRRDSGNPPTMLQAEVAVPAKTQ